MKYIVIELKTIDLAVFTLKEDETKNDVILTKLLNDGYNAFYSNSYDIILKKEMDFNAINYFIREGF